MSLKKYKRPDKNESAFTPKKIVGQSSIWHFLGLAEGIGFYDYYDRYDEEPYYGDMYYWDPEFEIPVYGEWIERRAGRKLLGKRMVGAYIPEESWLGKDGRRNKRIDSLFENNFPIRNTIGNITGFGG